MPTLQEFKEREAEFLHSHSPLMQSWLGDQTPSPEPGILAWVFLAALIASVLVFAWFLFARRKHIARVADRAIIAIASSTRRAFRASVRYVKHVSEASK